jgi:hypothetical protein
MTKEQYFLSKAYLVNDKIKRKYVNLKNINYLEISYKDDIRNKLLSFLETVTTAGCQ